MRFFLPWAAAAAPSILFLALASQGPVHSSAIYYNISVNGDGEAPYIDEYPRRYQGFGGLVGYCAFGGSRDDPWKVLTYDAASTDPAEQILTEIDVITRGREEVTGSNGKDIFESYGLGFPYFEVSAEDGNPDDGTWPYFYVKDVVGRCTSTLDFYAVSACADYQPDGVQDEFLLMQDGLDASGDLQSFRNRDARFDEGGVEKFRITEELFNLFNVTWDDDLQKVSQKIEVGVDFLSMQESSSHLNYNYIYICICIYLMILNRLCWWAVRWRLPSSIKPWQGWMVLQF